MVASISLTKNKTTTLLGAAEDHPPPSMQCSLCASTSEGRGGGIRVSPRMPGCSSLPANCPQRDRESSSTVKYQNLNVYVVGRVGHPKAQIVRIVHISDTRGAGEGYANSMPKGHILIHSGDFMDGPPSRFQSRRISNLFRQPRATSSTAQDVDCWKQKLSSINEFFRRQPHPYKIFVPGCWDYFGPNRPSPAEIQQHLPSVIYLEDSCCEILGLKIYGVPWTSADDLRPEDGKFHLKKRTTWAARSVAERLRRWLVTLSFRGSASDSTNMATQHQSQRRLRPISSCFGSDAAVPELRMDAGGPIPPSASPPFWPKVDSPDASVGANASSSIASSSSADADSATSPASPSSARQLIRPPSCCDGFILPDIQAVAERYARAPSDTNILVSHMPAWRPELCTHVVTRIKPYLHLSGHDFACYGVTWRSGVVFSNAALQLTPSYPRVVSPPPPLLECPRRTRCSTSSSSYPTTTTTPALPTHDCPRRRRITLKSSPPANEPKRKDANCAASAADSNHIPLLSAAIPRSTSTGGRPRRWRRRLSSLLGRLSLMFNTPGGASGSNQQPGNNYAPPRLGRVGNYGPARPTPSSLAAAFESDGGGGSGGSGGGGGGDGCFVVDPGLSVSGWADGGGDYAYSGPRNPLVFDVYVVIEKGINDVQVLPDYSDNGAKKTRS